MASILYQFFILIFCVSFCVCCSGTTSSAKNQKNTAKTSVTIDRKFRTVGYDSTILLIEKKVVNIVSWNGLFNIREFMTLYENSSYYLDSAINFLRRKEFSDAQKKIGINSMQRSELEDYIRLCVECKSLYDAGMMSEDILKWVINPNFSNRYIIVRNYENAEVIKLLDSISNDPNVSNEFKRNIENILDGKSLGEIREINGEAN